MTRPAPIAADPITASRYLQEFGCVLLRQAIAPVNIDGASLLVASFYDELSHLPVDQRSKQYASHNLLAMEELSGFEGLASHLAEELQRVIPEIVEASWAAQVLDRRLSPSRIAHPWSIRARRPTPERSGTGVPWHQDLSFLGVDELYVNCWIPLTTCGVDAPALDLIPAATRTAFEMTDGEAVDPDGYGMLGIPEALLNQAFGVDAMWTPALEIGDCLLFDSYCVHRTSRRSRSLDLRDSLEIRFG